MGLRVVKKTRIYEDIVEQIRQLVAHGHLKPGDQLPPERELSDKFQVSRASVREAIRALESMGLVTSRSGEGTYVATSIEAIFAPLAAALLKGKDTLIHIFEARKVLEPEIAAIAAERATPAEVSNLTRILREQAQAIAFGGTGVEADNAFHSALAHATKNTFFLRLNDTIVDSLIEARRQYLQTPGRAARSLAGHREILKAIQAEDPDATKRAMLAHLETIEESILFKPTTHTRKEAATAKNGSWSSSGRAVGIEGLPRKRRNGYDRLG